MMITSGKSRDALRAAMGALWPLASMVSAISLAAAPKAQAQAVPELAVPSEEEQGEPTFIEADARAVKASFVTAPGSAGWSAQEGFHIQTTDGSSRLRIGLVSAYRYEMLRLNGQTENGNAFLVMRPYLTGNVLKKWLQFWTSFEFAQNPPFLLDFYVELLPHAEVGVRVGQQPTPLSRHESFGAQQLLFPEWSPVTDYFWTGHDKGITALGSLFADKLNYWLGTYCGSPVRQFVCAHGSWVLEGRLTASPMGPMENSEAPYITAGTTVPTRYSFTLQATGGDYRDVKQTFNPAAFRFESEPNGEKRKQRLGALDFWLQSRRFTLFLEAYLRSTDRPRGPDPSFLSVGVWGQAGVMLLRTLDLGLRACWLNPSDRLAEDRAYTLEGQVAYYPFQNQMFVGKLRYGFSNQKAPEREGQLGGAELLTIPGKIHLLTLQLGLAI